MKLLRYGPPGEEKPGILDGGGAIRDLSGHVGDITGETIGAESLARLREIDPASLPKVEGRPRIGPCVGNVGKFVAIGLNYSDHAKEAGMAIPDEPLIFTKATSSISGPDDDIVMPRGASKVDWEVELGIVIGGHAKYVDEVEALGAIAGYCVVNDVSDRAFQLETSGQWVKGKSADTFGPIGPWLVTADEVPEPQNLHLWLEVNGESAQDGSTRTMIFPIPYLVSFVSRFMSLQPGDIITTGTPPGVGHGRSPPAYLNPGDIVTLSVEGLGAQRQEVLAAY